MNNDCELLPEIETMDDGIRVRIGRETYALGVAKEAFCQSFVRGVRWVRLAETPSSNDNKLSAFSKDELRELKQRIVTRAIRFRALNKLPLDPTPEDFSMWEVVIPVFEKAVEKLGGRSEDAYRLTARAVMRRLDEVAGVIANYDARFGI